MIEVPIWGWAIIGLGGAGISIGAFILRNHLVTLVRYGIAAGDPSRWWWSFFKHPKDEEETADQQYIATLLEDLESKEIP